MPASNCIGKVETGRYPTRRFYPSLEEIDQMIKEQEYAVACTAHNYPLSEYNPAQKRLDYMYEYKDRLEAKDGN